MQFILVCNVFELYIKRMVLIDDIQKLKKMKVVDITYYCSAECGISFTVSYLIYIFLVIIKMHVSDINQ